MTRGEVRWVNLDSTVGTEIQKTRPAVISSADALNRARRTVIVVPLSTGPRPRPPLVASRRPRVPDRWRCATRCEQIDRGRLLGAAVGRLVPADLRAVEEGLRAVPAL